MRRLCLLLIAFLLPAGLLAYRPVVIGSNERERGSLARAANLGWDRTGAYWMEIQPSAGQFVWAGADAAVDDARANGQQVLFILSGAPEWACGCTNGNTRPADINVWKAYVSAVSLHMKGRVAAYEIWNEPDRQGDSATGVGWDSDVDLFPRYVDYFVEASRIIRANDPAARVVGPALSGGWQDRTRKIFLQFENTNFPDGNASTFLDIVSMHQNASDSTTGSDAADLLWINKLSQLQQYNPRNAGKPVWVTEFGWKSGAIGEATQRDRISKFLTEMTGENYHLAPFKITHAFIYALYVGPSSSQGIYRDDLTPKLVVTDYLQSLAYPAVQPVRPPNDAYGISGISFFTLPPCRVVDTRGAPGPLGGPALPAGGQRTFPLALTCGLPATAKAVSVNVAVTLPDASGFILLYAGESPQPSASTINYSAGQTRANNAIVPVSAVGDLSAASSGTVNLLIDVNGYFE